MQATAIVTVGRPSLAAYAWSISRGVQPPRSVFKNWWQMMQASL